MMREKRGSKIKFIYIIAFGNNVVDSSDSFFSIRKKVAFVWGFRWPIVDFMDSLSLNCLSTINQDLTLGCTLDLLSSLDSHLWTTFRGNLHRTFNMTCIINLIILLFCFLFYEIVTWYNRNRSLQIVWRWHYVFITSHCIRKKYPG